MRQGMPCKQFGKYIILGTILDALGVFLFVTVFLFNRNVNILGLKSLPMDSLTLYVVAFIMIAVGMGTVVVGVFKMAAAREKLEGRSEENSDDDNEPAIIKKERY